MLVDLTGGEITAAHEAAIAMAVGIPLEYQRGMVGTFCSDAGLGYSATMDTVVGCASSADLDCALATMVRLYGSVEAIVFPIRDASASAASEAADSGYRTLARRLGVDVQMYVLGYGELVRVRSS